MKSQTHRCVGGKGAYILSLFTKTDIDPNILSAYLLSWQQASLKSSDTENVSVIVDADADDDDDMSTDDDDDVRILENIFEHNLVTHNEPRIYYCHLI